jgi:hypothetical protein
MLNWFDHNGKRMTSEHKDVFYEVGYHYGQKKFFCDGQARGRRILFEYAESIEDAKAIAEAHSTDIFELLEDL